mmetsp:Transcript_30075/g.55566  ORF Transcript_30075/g.55566 Transcript_30075/m.55566 type:complete len:353 (-) Transcript_30075:127-1185(-)
MKDYSFLLYKYDLVKPGGLFDEPVCSEVYSKKNDTKNDGWFFKCTFEKGSELTSLFTSAKQSMVVVTGHAPSNGMTQELYEGINQAMQGYDIKIAMGDFNEPMNKVAAVDQKKGKEKEEAASWKQLTGSLSHEVPADSSTATTRANEFALRKVAQAIQNTKNFASLKDVTCEEFNANKSWCSGSMSDERETDCKYAKRVCKAKDTEEVLDKAIATPGASSAAKEKLTTLKATFYKEKKLQDWYPQIFCAEPDAVLDGHGKQVYCNSLLSDGTSLIDEKPKGKQEDYIFSNVAFTPGGSGVWGCEDVQKQQGKNKDLFCPDWSEETPKPGVAQGWLSDHSLVWAKIKVQKFTD